MMFGQPQNISNIYNVIYTTDKGCLMKNICFLLLLCIVSNLAFSQKTFTNNDPQDKFNVAKEYYQKGQYNLAYPIFKELQQSIIESDRVNNTIVSQEITYYKVACSLLQN